MVQWCGSSEVQWWLLEDAGWRLSPGLSLTSQNWVTDAKSLGSQTQNTGNNSQEIQKYLLHVFHFMVDSKAPDAKITTYKLQNRK